MVVERGEIRDAFPVDEFGRERFWSRFELRSGDGGDSKRMSGVASVFHERAKVRLPDGRVVSEQVAPTAFNKTLDRGDIFLLWNHDMGMPLARTGAGNLELRVTDRGLEFDAELPDTQAGRDAAELVRRGIVNRCSFGFMMPPSGGDKITVEPDGTYLRTLTNVSLREVSLCANPAYVTTSAAMRSTAFAALCRSLGVDEDEVLSSVSTRGVVDLDTLRVVPSLTQPSGTQGLNETPVGNTIRDRRLRLLVREMQSRLVS